MIFQIICCILFCLSSNFTNQHNTVSIWVGQEHLQTVSEVCAIERVATNPDIQRLTQTSLFCLVHNFICQRPGSLDNTYFSLLVHVAWRDSNIAFIRLDNARAVWANESCFVLPNQAVFATRHVLLGDALCDTCLLYTSTSPRDFG